VSNARATGARVVGWGGTGAFRRTDVRDADDVSALVETAATDYGGVDVGVNNAAVEGVQRETADYPEDEWMRTVNVSLAGVWRATKYELRELSAGGGGAIVNTASILGRVAEPNFSAYVAAKHGVVGVTRAAAVEYAADGIRVNAVCPGYVRTPMIERSGVLDDDERRRAVVERHPIGRLGRPEEVAEAVVWLCSEAASFVTGHAMAVDGGYLAR
jgi:NAD(P)-dependent dehydrogenase (short-subunit alcohol dehydrogenase family)